MTADYLLFIGVSLVFSAFFSGLEIAFVSANRLKIELQRQNGALTGVLLSRFVRDEGHFISTMLLGNNLALVVYGFFMALLVEPWLTQVLPAALAVDGLVLFLQVVISTALVLVTAEFLPKSLFLANPNGLLNAFSLPLFIIYVLFYPVVWLVMQLQRFILKYILRKEYTADRPTFGLTDLNHFISDLSKTGDTEEDVSVDAKIFSNAIDFKTIRVRECMVPRTDVVAVDQGDPIETLMDELVESGHTKVLVYRESIDDITGYCHALELFKKPKDIESILQPVLHVPETMLANELMIQLISERRSLAVVVDEFGGTSGIVTLEDLIEEILGEIHDEHDAETPTEEQMEPGIYLLSARLEVDHLNDKYGWELEKGDYDTLGGYLLHKLERLPEPGETVDLPVGKVEFSQMADNRIEAVTLDRRDQEEGS